MKVVSREKKEKTGKCGGASIHLNAIALRKAKIVYNFGLSECNRVNVCFVIQ